MLKLGVLTHSPGHIPAEGRLEAASMESGTYCPAAVLRSERDETFVAQPCAR